METSRNIASLLTATPEADDSGCVGETCTDKQELFAQEWARTGNKAAAYRIVYQPDPRTAPGSVWSAASRVAAIPAVAKRHAELVQSAALETVVSIREALQWQLDIATADPNEIAYVAKRACRHCYGEGHRYQWIDDDEYMRACIKAIDAKGNPPDDLGGYGYSRAMEPAVECPHCLGQGIPEEVVNDTTKLTGKARKLYKGLDYKNGQWVVTMHDQEKAWEKVCRMLGAFNDKLDLRTPSERKAATKLPDGLNEQDAARAYLSLLG